MRKILLTLGLLVAMAMMAVPTASAQVPSGGFETGWAWAAYRQKVSQMLPGDYITSWGADCNNSSGTSVDYPCLTQYSFYSANTGTVQGPYTLNYTVRDNGASTVADPDGPYVYPNSGDLPGSYGYDCGIGGVKGNYKTGAAAVTRSFATVEWYGLCTTW